MGLSELTPGPVSWNVEVFVQALKELVSAGKRDNSFNEVKYTDLT